MTETEIMLRTPTAEDGSLVWQLVRDCKPLDENSMYCNVIQCDHFGDTCVLAEMDNQPVGWISAYIRPDDPETLFVWQVAVSPLARGRGLGRKMLLDLVGRDACAGVTQIQTTITRDNNASWGLFTGFAERHGADMEREAHFTSEDHFDGTAKTEHLVTIPLAEALDAAA
ncbi:diaminobutyrate acetyltransferase [Sulfitobacter sp. D35]|uniref:diaminobutyrate acetyltransferase n=1 Tax=Sulfitobacter sp. D35 TaxID=3083252 RepID=UPI00296F5AB1|nr:diaminobutyrate acetyltransferase [Sulfitobacter sp. D35]MDW4498743.1 diaminobutyrate acetyltransferase [Sulfitobacter sp. D35]